MGKFREVYCGGVPELGSYPKGRGIKSSPRNQSHHKNSGGIAATRFRFVWVQFTESYLKPPSPLAGGFSYPISSSCVNAVSSHTHIETKFSSFSTGERYLTVQSRVGRRNSTIEFNSQYIPPEWFLIRDEHLSEVRGLLERLGFTIGDSLEPPSLGALQNVTKHSPPAILQIRSIPKRRRGP